MEKAESSRAQRRPVVNKQRQVMALFTVHSTGVLGAVRGAVRCSSGSGHPPTGAQTPVRLGGGAIRPCFGSGAALCLLLLLCCTALTVSGEPASCAPFRPNSLLSPLWTFFDGVANATTDVAVTVDRRLNMAQTQIVDKLEKLSAKLQTTVTELGSELGAQSAKLAANSDTITVQLADISAELSAQNTSSSSQSTALAERLRRVESELTAIRAQRQCPLPARPQPEARDCSDLPAEAPSGVHLLRPGLGRQVPAYCDQQTDGGNWTVFQRRADIEPRQDFFLNWEAYKWGFGRLDAEFWWGLEHLWLMTSLLDRQYELRIDMEDFEGGSRYAVYQGFRITSEADGYRLVAVNYTGDAGDSLIEHSGFPFSTKDKDQDAKESDNCAKTYSGAWWYRGCHKSNLNGLYLVGKHASYADGVEWYGWKGHYYSLKTVTMKIRPIYEF